MGNKPGTTSSSDIPIASTGNLVLPRIKLVIPGVLLISLLTTTISNIQY